MKRCPSLSSLLLNQRKNITVKDSLRSSHCGYEGIYPKVCCPLNNNTTRIIPQKDRYESNGYETVLSSKLPSQKTCGRINQNITKTITDGNQPSNLSRLLFLKHLLYIK